MDLLNNAYQLFHHTAINQQPLSTLDSILATIRGIVALVGTLVILIGVIVGVYRFILLRIFHALAKQHELSIDYIRQDLGRTIVLGLEFIIAADVIGTISTPDYYSLGILAIIVVVRTFLSYSLSKEINSLSPNEQTKLNH